MPGPVTSVEDVLAVYPQELKQEEVAPVRDAIVTAQAEMASRYQTASEYAADQSNVAQARGRYLDGLGEDRDIVRSGDERDIDYRERVLAVPDLVTPLAIIKAVNAILGKYTTRKAQYLESIQDRAYLRFVPPEFDAPLDGPHGNGCTILGESPNYRERLYPEDEAINGAARVQCSPGGAWLFSDHIGRYFVLRVPDLSPLDTAMPALYFPLAIGVSESSLGRMFLRTTGPDPSPSYVYNNSATALDVYGAVVSAVEAIKGHSVRWKMISDPTLQ